MLDDSSQDGKSIYICHSGSLYTHPRILTFFRVARDVIVSKTQPQTVLITYNAVSIQTLI